MESERKIEIQIDVKAEDYRRVLFWYNRVKISVFVIGIIVAIPFLIWFLLFVEGTDLIDAENRDLFSKVVFYGMFVFLPVYLGLILFSILRQSKTLASISEITPLVFDENGLESKAVSMNTKSNWERIAKICETKTDFVIFPQENIFYPIPKRFFKSELQIIDFKKLVLNMLAEKAQLKN